MKLISMSLYGDRIMYCNGAVENAKLLNEIYPGWKMRVYCSSEVQTKSLEELGCQIIKMPQSLQHSGMFWRFAPAWEDGIERVIFRDADSRFNVREAVAVKAWEESDLVAHCMHDHPHHRSLPVFGGMWGIKGNHLPKGIYRTMQKYMTTRQKRVMDMRFLANFVHPVVQGSLLRHSSVELSWPSVPFPAHDEYNGFVGQQFDDNGRGILP